MKKTEPMQNTAAGLPMCILIGLVTVGLMLAVCALVVIGGLLPVAPYAVLASGSLTIGCFLAAFRAARCSTSRRLFWALAAGSGVLLCLFMISSVCCDGPIHVVRAAINTGCALMASLLGGIAGAAGRRKKRKR